MNVKHMLGEYQKWAKSSKNKVVDIEKEFTIKIAGVLVKGKIDRVEETPAGDLIVYDYKTGMSQYGGVKTDLQLNVYCLACIKLYKKLPKQAILFYPMIPDGGMIRGKTQLKRFRVYNVEEKHVENALKRLQDVVKEIKSLNFVATPTEQDCGWCDYRNICEEAV